MKKLGAFLLVISAAFGMTSGVYAETNITNNSLTKVKMINAEEIKTYTKKQEYEYGTLSLTVKYVIEQDTKKIVDITYSCTDPDMSYSNSEFDETYAKVVYKDNTGANRHGYRVAVTIYADEINE